MRVRRNEQDDNNIQDKEVGGRELLLFLLSIQKAQFIHIVLLWHFHGWFLVSACASIYFYIVFFSTAVSYDTLYPGGWAVFLMDMSERASERVECSAV